MTKRKADTRESIRTVTSNSFVEASGLDGISLKARKLLYIAISQCKQNDSGFYEYYISVQDFAKLMDIDPSNIYQEADSLTDELMGGFIKVSDRKGKFRKYTLFSKCEYTAGSVIEFKLNNDMAEFLLALKGSFTKPLLSDFLHMNSPYSMAVWHLMQKEMKSKKPGITDTIEFTLTLSELRKVTGTQKKLKQIGHFKERVLDKAIREIKDNCGVVISYTNIKEGRTVTGFHFKAENIAHMDISEIPQSAINKVNDFKNRQSKRLRELTPEEQKQYDRLTENSSQIELGFK